MSKPFQISAKTHRARSRPPFECIALLLQGGGALGAYQAGVYEALAEADIHPDWIAGIEPATFIGKCDGPGRAVQEPDARPEPRDARPRG